MVSKSDQGGSDCRPRIEGRLRSYLLHFRNNHYERDEEMKEHILRKPGGEWLAIIRTDSAGIERIYTPGGSYLGSYNPQADTTYYAGGIMFGRGNLLSALIEF
jgi:hypothetical protein